MLTPEAKLRRRSWIGASESAAILGLSEFQTAADVFWSKRPDLLGECVPVDEASDAMEMGNALEPVILDYAERTLDCGLARQVEIVSVEFPFMGCTLDGIGPTVRTAPNKWGESHGDVLRPAEFAVEAKYSGDTSGWGADDTDEVPTGYLIQCQHQMLVSGLPRCYLFAIVAAFRGARFRRFIIDANAELQAQILESCRAFWFNHVLPGIPPDDAPPPMSIIAGVVRPAGKHVALDASHARLAERWETTKKIIKEQKEHEEALKAELLAALGDAEIGALPDGGFLTYYPQNTNRIDGDALRREFPDIAKKCTTTTTHRVARIQKSLKGAK